jgi:hypothetical protein
MRISGNHLMLGLLVAGAYGCGSGENTGTVDGGGVSDARVTPDAEVEDLDAYVPAPPDAEIVETTDAGVSVFTIRDLADYLANNPGGWNENNMTLTGSGIGDELTLNLGFDPHLFPSSDGTLPPAINYEPILPGGDDYSFTGGFASVLSDAENPTTSSGNILQEVRPDGTVVLDILAFFISAPISIFDEEIIFGEGGIGAGGPGGCSPASRSLGTGCNDLEGGSGEPDAIIGRRSDGFLDYRVNIIMTYTPEAVLAAGGLDPKVPFILPALSNRIPGVVVTRYELRGAGKGTVTLDEVQATRWGLVAGDRVDLSLECDLNLPCILTAR